MFFLLNCDKLYLKGEITMLKKLIYSILAGISISIGSIVYLLVENKNVGALLFSVGIMMVIEFKFLLFTGYVPTQRNKQKITDYLINCLFVLCGNIIGCALVAGLMYFTRIGASLYDKALAVSNVKINDSPLSILILAMFCGFIIAMIVKANNFKKQVLYSAFMIAVFILSSFEHVVADAFYLTMSLKLFTWKGLLVLVMALLGNFIGGYASSFIDNEPKPVLENKENEKASEK